MMRGLVINDNVHLGDMYSSVRTRYSERRLPHAFLQTKVAPRIRPRLFFKKLPRMWVMVMSKAIRRWREFGVGVQWNVINSHSHILLVSDGLWWMRILFLVEYYSNVKFWLLLLLVCGRLLWSALHLIVWSAAQPDFARKLYVYYHSAGFMAFTDY